VNVGAVKVGFELENGAVLVGPLADIAERRAQYGDRRGQVGRGQRLAFLRLEQGGGAEHDIVGQQLCQQRRVA
jgi:hypothetical protein